MLECEQIHLVHAYHDHELLADRLPAFESHLQQCPACRAELHSLRSLSSKIVSADRPLPSIQFMQQLHARIDETSDVKVLRLARWLTAAAAVVFMASLIGLQLGPANPASAPTPSWESAAVLSGDALASNASDEHQMAQWMVDDLSGRLSADSVDASPAASNTGSAEVPHD